MTEHTSGRSGWLSASERCLEALIFKHRPWVLAVFALLSLVLAWQATQLAPRASFLKMIPGSHPYIQNFLEHRSELSGLGNSVRIAVAVEDGDIFSAEFQQVLKAVTDEVFYLPGVDRSGLKSLWTPNVRWKEVTEEGYVGGPVIPEDYDGSASALEALRRNVLRSGTLGQLVAKDFKSSIVHAPLLERHPDSGERLDYQKLSQLLEERIREAYSSEDISIHITGFAKVVGDLIEGATQVAGFFLLALAITSLLLYAYTRSWRRSLITLSCSVLAVVWQLGLLRSLGFGLDPYSMLVPFLVFAIAVSHGVQLVNGVGLELMQGRDALNAARGAFRMLYIPGLVALVSDALGFVTLMVIDISAIQELATAAAIGVAVIVLTQLVLLPVLLSYLSPDRRTQTHMRQQHRESGLWRLLGRCAEGRPAVVILTLATGMVFLGLWQARHLEIGDLDAGAPELRPDSRYNRDNAFMIEHYSSSSDVFVIMATTPAGACIHYRNLDRLDRFQWRMANVPGVQSAVSLADVAKRTLVGMSEGNLKWYLLSRNQYVLNNSLNFAPQGLVNGDCSLTPVLLFLEDHKARTLARVAEAAEGFAREYGDEDMSFLLAAGNAGIEAATNEVIAGAQYRMLVLVYGVVALLCLLTFRSWRALVCILTPLALTSVLCQALMATLGIGVKVATLPVIALGVGIGVDYGIYIYSRLQRGLRQGLGLKRAYREALSSSGRAVAFTGLTLAIGVATWIFSPIKFQADMGILLTFMFLWNMLGALILLPALARWILPASRVRPTAAAASAAGDPS